MSVELEPHSIPEAVCFHCILFIQLVRRNSFCNTSICTVCVVYSRRPTRGDSFYGFYGKIYHSCFDKPYTVAQILDRELNS